ncbi:MAG: DUF5667 domain-containing protein, partial [Anaerolineales bacterium]
MNKSSAELDLALQNCIEMILHGGRTLDEALAQYPHLRSELAPLLESALWVRSQRESLSLSPQRQADLRERVLKAVQAESLPRKRRELHPAQQHRRAFLSRAAWVWSTAVLLLICLLALTTSGVAFASQNSLPGDPLYAVKTAVEEARLLATWDATQRARLRLEYAERRLEEVSRLSQQGRYEETAIALSDYEVQLHLALQEAQRAIRIQSLQAQPLRAEIEAHLQAQSETLATLARLLPPAQAQAVQHAQNASSQALQNAASLLSELEPTLTPTATVTALASITPPAAQITLPAVSTPTESSVPPRLLRPTQSPTPR